MKLRNKETGGLATLVENGDCLTLQTDAGFHHYFSLARLNEEWEDYEEPENFYIVEQRGTVGSRFRTGDEYEKMFKEIGNYFETREEAEKAVEKRKNEIISKLQTLYSCAKLKPHECEWILQVIDYIKEMGNETNL